ncbi:MAG: peptidase S41 [Betaproteobacteria bacterium TMED82]|nr:MAG: peptidase S41 [Betaproteobacteria bacterium TMED82]|tara:strand:+ start:23731 stop:25170 length:1440 start_codon:yes stop_codon:yes gene_type:complete
MNYFKLNKVKIKSIYLVLSGLLGGVLISLALGVAADRSAPSNLPIEDLKKFASVFNAIKVNYVDPVDDSRLVKGAVSGMLSGLDPHSSYLDADAFRDLQVGTQGEFGGLGIEVGVQDGLIKVVSPIEDTPAAKAGVKAGDLIIRIDDKATKGMDLGDAVKLMRGKPDTKIELTIMREKEASPLKINIVRAVIQVKSVRSKLVDGNIGFLRISQFQEKTIAGVVRNFNKLEKTARDNGGKLSGLVLDLRNDPGGLLHAAVGVSAAFLPEGTMVVSTDGRQRESKKKFFADPSDYSRSGVDPLRKLTSLSKEIPMVVLVNAGSASASEIVAGALQDHERAQIMGTQSFGKGSVQTILPLSRDTAIKLTTARYYTPTGKTIQAKGIEPDFWVEETEFGDLTDRLRVREADLNRHLNPNKDGNSDGNLKAADSSRTINKNTEKSEQKKPVTFGSEEDFQLRQAINLLKGLPVKSINPNKQNLS